MTIEWCKSCGNDSPYNFKNSKGMEVAYCDYCEDIYIGEEQIKFTVLEKGLDELLTEFVERCKTCRHFYTNKFGAKFCGKYTEMAKNNGNAQVFCGVVFDLERYECGFFSKGE